MLILMVQCWCLIFQNQISRNCLLIHVLWQCALSQHCHCCLVCTLTISCGCIKWGRNTLLSLTHARTVRRRNTSWESPRTHHSENNNPCAILTPSNLVTNKRSNHGSSPFHVIRGYKIRFVPTRASEERRCYCRPLTSKVKCWRCAKLLIQEVEWIEGNYLTDHIQHPANASAATNMFTILDDRTSDRRFSMVHECKHCVWKRCDRISGMQLLRDKRGGVSSLLEGWLVSVDPHAGNKWSQLAKLSSSRHPIDCHERK